MADSIWVWSVGGKLYIDYIRPKFNIIAAAEFVKEITNNNRVIIHSNSKYNDLLMRFVDIMYLRLTQKDQKYGGKSWAAATPSKLLSHLSVQLEKLTTNVTHRKYSHGNIAEKAADIANFAMMIADVCGKLKS